MAQPHRLKKKKNVILSLDIIRTHNSVCFSPKCEISLKTVTGPAAVYVSD